MNWYWVKTNNWSGYLRLTAEEAEHHRRAGRSVARAFPPWVYGVRASGAQS